MVDVVTEPFIFRRSEMARHIIYTYRCTNGACRNVDKVADVPRKAQIQCSRCGSKSNLIMTEKTG